MKEPDLRTREEEVGRLHAVDRASNEHIGLFVALLDGEQAPLERIGVHEVDEVVRRARLTSERDERSSLVVAALV